MSRISLVRTNQPIPNESELGAVRSFLFGVVDGAGKDDRSRWQKFWSKVKRLEAGEVFDFEIVFPRIGKFHRRHMKIEQAVFDAQERFTNFEQFRIWVKVGAAWVDWCAGPKGGVVPIPRSISYARADQVEFEQFHAQVISFFRGPHAAPFLWRHLGAKAHEMMDSILQEFGE